ncbi:MAG: FGGY-family carbohydrate kinase [Myxococcales bacterium]|nr:FGGY-family carbohydrate kinase [Myxococcales bacterium]
MAERIYLGVDVGTGSARAGLYDANGRGLGVGVEPFEIFRPRPDHVEQSSDDIWRACGVAIRAALAQAGMPPEAVAGIGFDATCSLVLLDAEDRPVAVNADGVDSRNIIVWMDHRALAQTARINATGHRVLRYVGGTISPEMQTPKLLWLKEELPTNFGRAARFFDLPDFLTYRATGIDTRSLCSTTCKWTHLAHEAGDGGCGWDTSYFQQLGLGELCQDGFVRIGKNVRPMGERVGGLTELAAAELGLVAGTAVGVSIIDAHAGGLGMLGAVIDGQAPDAAAMERRLALIGGTSSCHMACSLEAHYPEGIWGPYFSAMIPGLWLTEGGQSATGALIDHVIDSHRRGAELRRRAREQDTTAYALLNARLDALAGERAFVAELTEQLHVLPYFHGNRSPRADATLRGMVSGLRLDDSVDSLARLYLATIQAIAHGTRHIIDTMNGAGFSIDTLIACGGDTKNPVFVREHADISGCRIVLPREPEAVLLGSAVLGAVASGDQRSVLSAMAAMNAAGACIEAAGGEVASYHARKHHVFHRMYDDQRAHAALMAADADQKG